MRKIVLVIFAALVVVSCGKDDEVAMNLLQEHKFVFESYRNPNDSTTDEFVYSFDADSMTVSGPRYEYTGTVRIPTDIVSEKWPYFIDGNRILFPPVTSEDLIVMPESISPVEYRSLQWKVLLLNENQMSADIIGNSTLVGHAEFKVGE